MTDITIPAPVAQTESTDTAAPQVTTQNAVDTVAANPQAEAPDGSPQAQEPAGEEEQKKTWEERRKERNRERWQQYKQAKEIIPQKLALIEQELKRLSSVRPPDLSQITDPNEELVERMAYKVQENQRQQVQERYAEEQQRAAMEYQHSLKGAAAEMVEYGRTKFPDFDQVVGSAAIHDQAVRHIVESENAIELAYYLGKNPAESRVLYDTFQSDPYRAMKHLGQIEAKISAAPKTTTTAPKPASVLSGGKSPLAFDASRASVSDMAAHLKKAGIIR